MKKKKKKVPLSSQSHLHMVPDSGLRIRDIKVTPHEVHDPKEKTSMRQAQITTSSEDRYMMIQ